MKARKKLETLLAESAANGERIERLKQFLADLVPVIRRQMLDCNPEDNGQLVALAAQRSKADVFAAHIEACEARLPEIEAEIATAVAEASLDYSQEANTHLQRVTDYVREQFRKADGDMGRDHLDLIVSQTVKVIAAKGLVSLGEVGALTPRHGARNLLAAWRQLETAVKKAALTAAA